MYFNYSPHGYCVEEAFDAFVPQYLERAAAINDKRERHRYLMANIDNQFADFEEFVRTHICGLVKSIEGLHDNNPFFARWVFTVAKKHEYKLMKEYYVALNNSMDRKMIQEKYLKELH